MRGPCDRFEETPPEVRRRWARTGTSLPNAVLLQQLAAQVRAELPSVPNPRDPVAAFLLVSDRAGSASCSASTRREPPASGPGGTPRTGPRSTWTSAP